MQMASFTGLIRIIVIFLAVYYGLRLIMRFLAPFFMRYMSKKFEQKVREQYKQTQQNQSKTPPEQKPKDDKLGEYIDYEEID
jgi:hypothetical protein